MNYVEPIYTKNRPEVTTDFEVFHGRDAALAGNSVNDRKWEFPWHRAAISLLSAGYTIRDTAAMVEKSETSVKQLAHTPWVAERIANKMEKSEDCLMEAMRSEPANSFNKLIELRDNPKVSPTVQAAVCNSILDRVMGKATNKIEVSQGPKAEDPVREAERLRQEISAGIERAAKL